MKRLKRLEKRGWTVVNFMSGNGCIAKKGLISVIGTSVTNLHYKILGY